MRYAVVCICSLVGLAACANATPAATVTPIPAATIALTATTAPTVELTATLVPSATPAASATASPAASATAAATATVAASATTAASATAAPSATAAQPTAKPTAAEFTPQQNSVWDTELSPNTDNMQGTCSNPVNPVYGLVQITPQGSNLVWKNQEPTPYTMSRLRANVWQYSGPAATGDGTVTMLVQFTSATTLKLTRTFVSTAEPNCTHVHTYTGDFKWYR